jgi:hypothetical protein
MSRYSREKDVAKRRREKDPENDAHVRSKSNVRWLLAGLALNLATLVPVNEKNMQAFEAGEQWLARV